MSFAIGQTWASNLPGKRKLKILSLSSASFLHFPIELVDDKGNKFYATDDGLLKQVIGPTGLPYRLTILIREKDIETLGKSFSERQEIERKMRASNNRKVLHDYRLKK